MKGKSVDELLGAAAVDCLNLVCDRCGVPIARLKSGLCSSTTLRTVNTKPLVLNLDGRGGYTAKTTEFHKVTCFNGLGHAAATRTKAAVVAINGYLHYSAWQDPDGSARYGCEIIADRIDFF